MDGDGLFVTVPPPLPPPQPGRAMKRTNIIRAGNLLPGRFNDGIPIKQMPSKSAPPGAPHQIE
jgi:hypothetical protein